MSSFTKYENVNEIIDFLLVNISRILKEEFIGMYLHGSLALNDFVLERSDIDIVFVTKSVISNVLIEKLKEMHDKLTSSNLAFAKRIECVYVPIDSLRQYIPEKAFFPCLHVGGTFYTDGFGTIEKHVLREKGIIIKGPSPKTFIQSVSSSSLQQVARESLVNWWLLQLKNHSRLIADDYQVYAVLTMCRALYTLEKGEIVSKSEAVSYALKTIDSKWFELINNALKWKIDDRFDKLNETMDFMKFTFEKVGIKIND